ncbi:DEAD/DEAH box helicase [Enterococcus sp.]|uniref:DEAD/DEAH box helicase n=1 Tax=Enterococcus sp. TaxID=35783 RepID=UPI0025C1CB38|nr:DEAD/DEAH box helicase [Enterococcus sp.]
MTATYLSEVWQKKWQDSGFSAPSLIQERVYPLLKAGQSVVGVSPTGSGKTLAYLLPLLEAVKVGEGNQLLILTSSQELAMQVTQVARDWAQLLDLQVLPLIGGANTKRQIEKLKTKPEVLVGTPGRVLELIKLKKVKTQQIQAVVLDEVDQLLKEGAFGLASKILALIPKQATRSFFSATANEVLKEIEMVSETPEIIDVTKEDQSKGLIHHYYLNYPSRKLVDALRRLAYLPDFQGLIFFNELSALGNAEEKLLYHGLPVASLASDQNKLTRRASLDAFRQGKICELLTTDVAARGLDVDQLGYVVNTEVPKEKEAYLHRAGRVGRMGNEGTVITIVQDHTVKDLKKIATQLDISLQEVFLHGGALHTEQPETKPELKKEQSVQKNSRKNTEKLHTMPKKTKKKQKSQKDKGKRRH